MFRIFRKIVPIILTLAALVGAFLIYNHFQPKAALFTGAGRGGMPPDTQPFSTDNSSLVSKGKIPWLTTYDKDTGRRISRFKADFFDPRGNGTWYVTNPVIELFQTGGQVIQIKGADGVVHVPPGSDKGVMQGAPMGPPRDGNLRDVMVRLYNSETDQAGDLPQMTLTMPNAQFDYDTNRLFTYQYTDRQTGIVTPADQVPVTIRGKDYDFDGTGLVLFWDDSQKQQQIKSLEIAHGKQLVIHNPSALSPTSDTATPVTPPSQPLATNNQSPAASPPALSPSKEPGTAIKPEKPSVSSSRQRYQATFNNNVRVIQSGQELVRADLMKIDFITKEGASNPSPSTLPPTTPLPNTPSSNTPPAPSTASTPTIPVPAQPQPITITWTGPLRVVPIENLAADLLNPGQSIIHLIGSPVVVHQKASTPEQPPTDIQSAELIYHSVDDSVHLIEGPGVPVTITQIQPDGAGMVARAKSAKYSKLDRSALLDGNVDVREFDANVKEPKMHLTSSRMKLLFDPAAKAAAVPVNAMESMQLREMDATGDVKCVVPDAHGVPGSIQSQELKVFTAPDHDGKMYAKTILADGAVHALQQDQELTSDHLAVDLQPSSKPPRAKEARSGGAA